jgi:hypothetical protein
MAVHNLLDQKSLTSDHLSMKSKCYDRQQPVDIFRQIYTEMRSFETAAPAKEDNDICASKSRPPPKPPAAVVCAHGHRSGRCRQCGTSAPLCAHGRRRWECRDCGGASICPHGRRRPRCRECGGVSICSHGRVKWTCRSCGSHCFCVHGRQRYKCKDCSAAAGSGSCKAGQTALRARTSLTQGQPLPSSPPRPPLPSSPLLPPLLSTLKSNAVIRPAALHPAVHASSSGTCAHAAGPVLFPTQQLIPDPSPSPSSPDTPLLFRLLPPLLPRLSFPLTTRGADAPPGLASTALVQQHPDPSPPDSDPAEAPPRLDGSAFSVWPGRRKPAATGASLGRST